MQNPADRAQRLKPEEMDGAIDEALQRVSDGADLSPEELEKINGGRLPSDPPIDVMGAMITNG